MSFSVKNRRVVVAIVASAFAGLLLPGAASAKVFLNQSSTVLRDADAKPRSTVGCPGGKNTIPLGGGMITTPNPDSDGEGVYPHSFERLGAQRGFHVTPVLYDPSQRSTTPRTMTLQVMCGPKSRPVVDMRKTVYVAPGQVKSVSVSCPGKRGLFSGGFQRTNFVSRGGNFATGSYASSPKTWTVAGSAFGSFGGELTAIAYCRTATKVTAVSAQTVVRRGEFGQVETPACPGRKVMVSGGHSTSPANTSLFADGFFTPGRTWVAGVYNQVGPPTTLTSYGYCHSKRFPKPRKERNPFQSVEAPGALKEAEKATASERVVNNGCYPAPDDLAAGIARRTGIKTAVAASHSGVNRAGTVYVLSNGHGCDLTRLAMRKSGRIYTINTATGRVKAK